MIVLLPVGVLRVPFQLASGRPYSYLEELILTSLSEEAKGLDQLCVLFAIHRRIVIEVLVTLMYSGWIALDPVGTESGNRYCITLAGKRALRGKESAGTPLPAATTVRKAGMSVVLERTLGQVARNSEVSWQPRQQLNHIWNEATILPKRHVRDSVGPALLAPIVPRLPGEWIRDVGLPFPTRQGSDYAVLYADVVQKELLGVPHVWRSRLTEFVFEHLEEQGLSSRPGVVLPDEVRPLLANDTLEVDGRGEDLGASEVSPEEFQFLVGQEEHEEELVDFLSAAESWCVIVSPLTTRDRSQRVDTEIRKAIARGVSVAVLWSQDACEQSKLELNDVRTMLEEWGGLAEAQGGRGTALYNGSNLGGHGCVAIGDIEGTVCAMLGNFAWLGETKVGCAGASISCKTTSQGVIGVLVMGLVEMMQADRRTKDTAEELRLRSIGQKLRGQAASTREKRSNVDKDTLSERGQHGTDSSKALCKVSVVFGAQHYDFGLRDFRSAHTSIDVAIGKARWEGVVDLCWDLDRWAADSVEEVGVGLINDAQGGVDSKIDSLMEELKKTSRISVDRRRVGGYYIVDSSVVLLSSVNWANVGEQEPMGSVSEIGVRMEGEELVEAFRKKMKEKCG